MTFYWWDDAIGYATELARDTRIRHKVHRVGCGWWAVDLADAAVLEACS